MASKVNVLLTMTDRLSKPMREVTHETKKAERQFKTSQNTLRKFGQGFNARVGSIVGGVGRLGAAFGGIGAILSIGALTSFANEAVNAANVQIEAETKLGAILQNVQSIRERGPEAWKEAQKNLSAYAGELQKVGVIGDEVTLSGMQQLATFQLNDNQIKTLSAGMTDLIAQQKGMNATAEDAVTIANMIGKAMDGNAGALSRVGITMSDAQKEAIKMGDANQRAAIIAQVLKQNVGGVNEALAKTDAGRLTQSKNIISDMMEEIGMKIIPLKAGIFSVFAGLVPLVQDKLFGILDNLTAKFSDLQSYIEENKDAIQNGVGTALDVVSGIFSTFATVLGFVLRNLDLLIPILAMLVIHLTGLKVINAITIAMNAFKSVMAATAVQGGILNAVLQTMGRANVILLAITLIVGALVWLYMNFDKIKAIAMDVFAFMVSAWNVVVAAFNLAVNAIASILNTVFSAVLDTFTAYLNGLITFITGVFTGNWQMAWQGIVDIFRAQFGWIADFASSILNSISDKLASMKNSLSSLNPFGSSEAVPGHATGTSYFKGGLTRINEVGGEIVNLPSGTQIIPHDVSVKALSSGGGRPNVTINLTIQGNVIGNEEFKDDVGRHIVSKLTSAMGNM